MKLKIDKVALSSSTSKPNLTGLPESALSSLNFLIANLNYAPFPIVCFTFAWCLRNKNEKVSTKFK
jgi:hypothetical protein